MYYGLESRNMTWFKTKGLKNLTKNGPAYTFLEPTRDEKIKGLS